MSRVTGRSGWRPPRACSSSAHQRWADRGLARGGRRTDRQSGGSGWKDIERASGKRTGEPLDQAAVANAERVEARIAAVAGSLIAAAGASKRVARSALAGLVLLLPLAYLSGWASAGGHITDARAGWRQLLDAGALEPLLVITLVVLVPAIVDYGATTWACSSGHERARGARSSVS